MTYGIPKLSLLHFALMVLTVSFWQTLLYELDNTCSAAPDPHVALFVFATPGYTHDRRETMFSISKHKSYCDFDYIVCMYVLFILNSYSSLMVNTCNLFWWASHEGLCLSITVICRYRTVIPGDWDKSCWQLNVTEPKKSPIAFLDVLWGV